jgi:hypothetical protein
VIPGYPGNRKLLLGTEGTLAGSLFERVQDIDYKYRYAIGSSYDGILCVNPINSRLTRCTTNVGMDEKRILNISIPSWLEALHAILQHKQGSLGLFSSLAST